MMGAFRWHACAFIFLVFFGAAARAENCSTILAFSKIRSESVRSVQDFEQAAKSYCRAYTEQKARGNSGGGTVGYAGFTVGGSSASSSSRFSAEQICNASSSLDVRADAYRTYVEAIAPGAYDSYDNCLKSRLDVSFSEPSVAAKEADVLVGFTPSRSGATARLTARGAGGATCNWHDTGDSRQIGNAITVDRPGQFLLVCTRNDSEQASSVRIFDANAGTSEGSSLLLPWTAYRDGVPVNLIDEYNNKVSALTVMDDMLRASVVAVRTASCPQGFSPWTEAQGRFLRGIDPAGEMDPDGVRAVGSLQDSSNLSHDHATDFPANRTGNPAEAVDNTPSGEAGNSRRNYWRGNRAGRPTGQTEKSGATEARPKNVAVLFCVRS